MKAQRPVYIVGGQRVPFVKSLTTYVGVSTQDLMIQSLESLVQKYGLAGQQVGDVALGAVMSSSSNWNLARECVLGSSLHPYTPAYNVQRACGTGLETTWQLSLKIAAGQIENGIAGGVDTNSDIPIEVSDSLRKLLMKANMERTPIGKLKVFSGLRLKFLKPKMPAVVEPRTGLSMGEHCEKMVKEWKISRQDQDQWALESHQKAARSYADGFHNDLVLNYKNLKMDSTIRGDTTLEKLAKLKPAFDRSEAGSLTAGNSSPLTDGSSAVLVASEDALKKYSWRPLARFVDAEAAALDYVHGDGLLMAPTVAVGRLLARNNLRLQDFDYYEIHEAFAGQVLCTLKAWQDPSYCRKYFQQDALGSIDRSKINVVGSSVAVGHPFAATGARIVATLSHLLAKKPKARGLISICTAGGMGVAAILESVG